MQLSIYVQSVGVRAGLSPDPISMPTIIPVLYYVVPWYLPHSNLLLILSARYILFVQNSKIIFLLPQPALYSPLNGMVSPEQSGVSDSTKYFRTLIARSTWKTEKEADK